MNTPIPQSKFSTKKRWLMVFAVMSLVVLFVWLKTMPKRHHIPDVTKPQTIILQAPSGASQIRAITVRFVGSIDGAASLTAGSQTWELNVSFDHHLGPMDCYSTNYTLEYVPKGVRSGRVTIRYKFLDSSIIGEMEREISKEYRTR